MLHDPYGDHLGISTNELICALIGRVDASNSLFSLLALMVGVSSELSIERQWRLAASLHDTAELIEARPPVRDFVDLLKLTRPAYTDEATPC
jgi:hypothetical protein